jgi:hypothetical protein
MREKKWQTIIGGTMTMVVRPNKEAPGQSKKVFLTRKTKTQNTLNKILFTKVPESLAQSHQRTNYPKKSVKIIVPVKRPTSTPTFLKAKIAPLAATAPNQPAILLIK